MLQNLDAKISQEQIGFVYDKLSRIYDIWGKLTESRARSRAIELASIRDGESVLEVAVGTGLAFYEIVKGNPHGNNIGGAVGIENNSHWSFKDLGEMLRSAKTLRGNNKEHAGILNGPSMAPRFFGTVKTPSSCFFHSLS